MLPIYAVYRFNNQGSSTQTEPPSVTTDYRAFLTPETRFDAAKLDALQPGESSVLPLRMDGHLIAEGYRITRLPAYAANALMFDTQAKEFVKVTNGICVLDHSSPEGYAASHNGGVCVYAPHEAIALRPVVLEGDTFGVAWTYRGVDAAYLQPVTWTESIEKMFSLALNPDRKRKNSIGRI